jgi:hypothetical protein
MVCVLFVVKHVPVIITGSLIHVQFKQSGIFFFKNINMLYCILKENAMVLTS